MKRWWPGFFEVNNNHTKLDDIIYEQQKIFITILSTDTHRSQEIQAGLNELYDEEEYTMFPNDN